jgi:hypothetical protein
LAFTGTSYYHTLTSYLKDQGHDVGALPYDFRYIHDPRYHVALYQKYKACIEAGETDEKVTLICHSTGGLVLQHFLHTFISPEWIKKHIARVYYLDVPFEGCPAALHLLLDLSKQLARPTGQLSLFRLLDLVPNFHLAGGLYVTLPSGRDPVVKKGGRWLYPGDIEALLMGCEAASRTFLEAQDFVKCRGLSLEGVPQVVCFSRGLPTPVLHDYDYPNSIMGDGDGLVPVGSLSAPTHWEHAPCIVQMDGLEHSRMNSHYPILRMIALSESTLF